MGLFDIEIEEQPKKKPKKLIDTAKEYFSDKELLHELQMYLESRRQSHNYPSRISWEMQLKLLQEIPQTQQIQKVRKATLCGYRSIVYEDNIVKKKTHKLDLSTQAF